MGKLGWGDGGRPNCTNRKEENPSQAQELDNRRDKVEVALQQFPMLTYYYTIDPPLPWFDMGNVGLDQGEV